MFAFSRVRVGFYSNSTEALTKEYSHSQVPIRLANSGRGVEALLEAAHNQQAAQNKPAPEQLLVSRGPLIYAYSLFKMEIHASSASSAARPDGEPATPASEHSIDGRSFDGELQLHFYNAHLAPTAAAALRMAADARASNLFAAISLLIIKTPADNSTTRPSLLNALLDKLQLVASRGEFAELKVARQTIDELLAGARDEFVAYKGSLNKPPCAETVDWIVANKPLLIDANKWQALFTKLRTGQDNVRPTRAANKRLLRFRFEQPQTSGSKGPLEAAGSSSAKRARNWSFVSNRKCEFKLNAP